MLYIIGETILPTLHPSYHIHLSKHLAGSAVLSISFTVSLDGGTHNVCFPCINIPPTEYIYAAQDPPDVSNIHLFQYDRMEQRQNIIIRYMQGVFSKKTPKSTKKYNINVHVFLPFTFSSIIYVCT